MDIEEAEQVCLHYNLLGTFSHSSFLDKRIHSFSPRNMLNDTKNNIRYASCASQQRHHTNYCYIRETSAAAENSSPSTCHLEVANVTDVPTHIQSFLKSHPRAQPSYAVDLHVQNAKSANSSLLSTLYNSGEEEEVSTNAIALNLTSIEAVRMTAECIDDIRIQQDCCFSAPAKSRRHILEALSLGVSRMTVSYPAEVMRISSASKTVELVLSLASTADNKEAARAAETLRVAKAKGMKVVGIALRCGWDHPVATNDVEEALVRLRDAYDEATSCGHDVRMIDLGSLIARAPDGTEPTRRRRSCSVIMEDGHLSRIFCESAFDEKSLPRVRTNTLLDQHFPPSLGLRIRAEHAQYLFPQEEVLQKWFTTPKERRPAPSFHRYMASGCTTKTAYICSYSEARPGP